MPTIATIQEKATAASRAGRWRAFSEFPEQDDPVSTASLRATHLVHYASPWVNSLPRRCLDCLLASLALTALLPVMAACALLVRLSSPGPILFRQRRMGRNGVQFDFYKFRSMTAELRPGAPTHTVQGDCRITRVGALLRKYKLDELPQFWNVLKGDMSMVGPRPKLPQHEALFLACRPGITGEATLTFRNEEQLLSDVPDCEVDAFYEMYLKPVKAELDIAYMRSATLKSDLRLLLRTVLRCLAPASDPCLELTKLRARCRASGVTANVLNLPRAVHGVTNHVTTDPAPAAAD